MSSPAPACKQAISDANKRWPGRKKASDGIMGDARHQARKSDHNLGNAFDLTHDPASGCDGSVIASLAIKDPRVKYVIWNHRIYNRARASEGWRPYKGSNPHTKHCHVSILASSRNDTRSWPWVSGAAAHAPAQASQQAETPPKPVHESPPKPAAAIPYPNVVLRNGSRGPAVKHVQGRLASLGWQVAVDGIFGLDTDRKVRSFQRRAGLPDDGAVGRKTWQALFG